MRRQIVGAALCLGVATSALVVSAGAGGADAAPAAAPAAPGDTTAAEAALDGAVDVLATDEPADRAPDTSPEATLALRDLAVALPRLAGADRDRAEALLARPTDGRRDPYGDGYTVPSRRDCAVHVCVHWVNRTRDAPPSRRWVTRTQRVVGSVWRTEVGDMGFRRPLADRGSGGNRRLDVYLKELGGQGLYGYCAPEPAGSGRRAPGYCVLDDDYARSQFGRAPGQTLRVTAAHEFLHVVQFGYDFREDPWLLEATATWIEERYADGVDDNRQYLAEGQVGTPAEPLDSLDGLAEYGNWAFFEHLAQQFGDGIVRRTWEQAGEAPGDGGAYSVQALARALPGEASFGSVFADYTMALSTPAASFPEGSAWGPASFVTSRSLGPDDTRDSSHSLDHLSSKATRWVPGGGLDTSDWQLRIGVDGPPSAAAPVAGVVRVKPDGTTERTELPLDAEGDGQVTVPFNQIEADAVHVVLGNASARYACHRGTVWACDGVPRDDDRQLRLSLAVVRQP